MAERVLLLLPTSTYRATDFLEAAKRQNIEVVVVSDEASTMEALSPDNLLSFDFRNPKLGVERVAAFHERRPVSGLVAVDELTAVAASYIGERLGLPHNPPLAARRTRLKHEMRQALAAAAIPGPRFWVSELRVPETARLRGAWESHYPLVLKPVFLSGSRGVISVRDSRELLAGWARIEKLLSLPEPRERDPEHAELLLVEEFVPGREVAVEAILDDSALTVLAIFDKPDPMDGPYFEETIYVTPSRLSDETQRRIHEATRSAARAIGLTHGPIHAELRVDGDKATILEIAARSIGGLCARSLRFGLGLSLEELILLQALGRPVAVERTGQASGVMMLPIPAAGTLVGVHGTERASRVPGVEGIQITMRPGSELVPLPEGSMYLGFAFARAESPALVESALREAHSYLRFEIES